jgi:hypothetical protein
MPENDRQPGEQPEDENQAEAEAPTDDQEKQVPVEEWLPHQKSDWADWLDKPDLVRYEDLSPEDKQAADEAFAKYRKQPEQPEQSEKPEPTPA